MLSALYVPNFKLLHITAIYTASAIVAYIMSISHMVSDLKFGVNRLSIC